jgi:ribosomal protein L32E
MWFPEATTGLEPIGYRGVLLSTLLHATVYVTHNLLNVLVQIANKMGFKRKKKIDVVS